VTSLKGLSVAVTAKVGALKLDVHFEMGAETVVLVGPNGAGKSTILSMILGVRSVDAGRILINNQPVLDTVHRLNVPIEQRKIGYVPQSYALFPHQTVRENIDFAVKSAEPALPKRTRRMRVEALLHELDLDVFSNRMPNTLSGGERQRVALARALSVGPQVLLLDEPLSALDVASRDAVRVFLSNYLKSVALPTIVVTHEPSEARQLGHRIVVLESGRISQSGTWDELKDAPASSFVQWFTANA
jgi:molybdate transport system ATP-binding protein